MAAAPADVNKTPLDVESGLTVESFDPASPVRGALAYLVCEIPRQE